MSQTQLDQLERLAKLHLSGALDAQEFAAAKAQIVGGTTRVTPQQPIATGLLPHDLDLRPVWRERFRFFDEHGMPGTSTYRRALRQTGWRQRGRLTFSPLAFLLGPFYLLYLGLWRPTITLAVATVIGSIALDQLALPDELSRALWTIPASLQAIYVIPLYYLRRRHDIQRWNPIVWRPVLPEDQAAAQ